MINIKNVTVLLILVFLTLSGFSLNDTLLNKITIKTTPLKFLFPHPNAGVEIPLSAFHHIDINFGVFFKLYYFGDEWFEELKGFGISPALGYKFFLKNKKDNLYLGPNFTYRYIKTGYERIECENCYGEVQGGPLTEGIRMYQSFSSEIKGGYQNRARTLDYYFRIGIRYFWREHKIYKDNFYVDRYYDEKIERENGIKPLVTIGFNLSLPLGRKKAIRSFH